MPAIDPSAVAVNAAGIADAFRLAQITDDDGDNRLQDIMRVHNDWTIVMERVAHAGELMERYRIEFAPNAFWGQELPYRYDAWDAIAQALWTNIESVPLEALVRDAIEQSGGGRSE